MIRTEQPWSSLHALDMRARLGPQLRCIAGTFADRKTDLETGEPVVDEPRNLLSFVLPILSQDGDQTRPASRS
jgi:hypothetical protein